MGMITCVLVKVAARLADWQPAGCQPQVAKRATRNPLKLRDFVAGNLATWQPGNLATWFFVLSQAKRRAHAPRIILLAREEPRRWP
jgi:hypothetical protein